MPSQAVHRSAAVVVVIITDVRCRLRRRLSTISQLTSTHAGPNTHTHTRTRRPHHRLSRRNGWSVEDEWTPYVVHFLRARVLFYTFAWIVWVWWSQVLHTGIGKIVFTLYRARQVVSFGYMLFHVGPKSDQPMRYSFAFLCIYLVAVCVRASDVRLYVWRPNGFVATRTFTLLTCIACVSVWENNGGPCVCEFLTSMLATHSP